VAACSRTSSDFASDLADELAAELGLPPAAGSSSGSGFRRAAGAAFHGVALIDASLAGWRLLFVNEAFASATGVPPAAGGAFWQHFELPGAEVCTYERGGLQQAYRGPLSTSACCLASGCLHCTLYAMPSVQCCCPYMSLNMLTACALVLQGPAAAEPWRQFGASILRGGSFGMAVAAAEASPDRPRTFKLSLRCATHSTHRLAQLPRPQRDQ
jgi:hypothetical protein